MYIYYIYLYIWHISTKGKCSSVSHNNVTLEVIILVMVLVMLKVVFEPAFVWLVVRLSGLEKLIPSLLDSYCQLKRKSMEIIENYFIELFCIGFYVFNFVMFEL